MVSFPTPQNYTYSTFGGIRLRNGVNSNGVISAEICQNIEFIPQGLSNNVKIVTSKGNTLRCQYEDYKIIKGFETVQDGTKYCIVYATNGVEGRLLTLNSDNTYSLIIDELHPIEQANGITMTDSAYDVFVFTNGQDYIKVCYAQTPIYEVLEPEYNGSAVTGLTLAEQDGSLVIGSDKGYVIASRKGDITDWDYVTPSDSNKPWYQLFGKPVTAVVPFISGLLVFTADDSTILQGNFSTTDDAVRQNASLGGCMSFESWVIHDKYLFFYDNNQKNIYYFQQNDYGQTQLGSPLAVEVQQMFEGITKFQFVSYISDNKNELWILTNKNKFIFDYNIKEWSERVCQDLTSYFVYDNQVYSTTAEGKILYERVGDIGIYDDAFYGSKYTMQTINIGSYSNLKEMELPPIVTVTADYGNKFWLETLVDDKKTKRKFLEANSLGYAEFWDGVSKPKDNNLWGVAIFAPDNSTKLKQLKGKQISNFYTLKFSIYTEEIGQSFSVAAFELKQITQEVDTMGHK